MLAINQVSKVCDGGLSPGERTSSDCAQPPVGIAHIEEQDLRLTQPGEVAEPHRVLPIQQVTESGCVAHALPSQCSGINRTQPPIAVTAIIKEHLLLTQT